MRESWHSQFVIHSELHLFLLNHVPKALRSRLKFLELPIDKDALKSKNAAYIKTTSDQIISTLKEFGILRRASKKFAKAKLKEISKALK